jgi:hypothetical protein
MKMKDLNGQTFSLTINPNKLEYCDRCETPMFLIYYHPEKKIRTRCHDCGGHSFLDSAEMLKERRADAQLARRMTATERLKTLGLEPR